MDKLLEKKSELNNSLNDLNDFVNEDTQSRQDTLSEHSQTHKYDHIVM